MPVFRFAPSPNGALHLGHAYSALLNFDQAQKAGGRLLLRFEDIDHQRCRQEYEQQMLDDLNWLGIEWSGSPCRQSEHFSRYRQALGRLERLGLVYPAFMSRAACRREIEAIKKRGGNWPSDPDGVPHYPEYDRKLDARERQKRINRGDDYALRLDMAKARAHINKPVEWVEEGAGPLGETGRIEGDPGLWGDVILARRDVATSYHLCVVVDDAWQGISHVVRGCDLFHATSLHRLLQELLGLDAPVYHHHRLILTSDGRKLSKSEHDTGICQLRGSGATVGDIRQMVGM